MNESLTQGSSVELELKGFAITQYEKQPDVHLHSF